MLRPRIIPCLQLLDGTLVKTVRFDKPAYIGDPINTVRIFNELEVDELCLQDIRASQQGRQPDLELLQQIANECFMPLSYGGGIDSFDTAKRIFEIGFEKIILNTAAYRNPKLITEISAHFGSQAVIVSIDVKKNIWGKYQVYVKGGSEKINTDPITYAQQAVHNGAGEILLTSIDREGTWQGYDLNLIKNIASSVNVPLIANGGAGNVQHVKDAIISGGASAVGLGSMIMYQRKGMGVLINMPQIDMF